MYQAYIKREYALGFDILTRNLGKGETNRAL